MCQTILNKPLKGVARLTTSRKKAQGQSKDSPGPITNHDHRRKRKAQSESRPHRQDETHCRKDAPNQRAGVQGDLGEIPLVGAVNHPQRKWDHHWHGGDDCRQELRALLDEGNEHQDGNGYKDWKEARESHCKLRLPKFYREPGCYNPAILRVPGPTRPLVLAARWPVDESAC